MSKLETKLPAMHPRMLTDRKHVQDAIDEFDELGREAFIEKYGGRKSLSFFLVHKERLYDSKPIVASALTRQLQSHDLILCNRFSGGDATVKRALEELGLSVRKIAVADPSQRFNAGQRYHRKRDIHDVYGGQERGGICTPSLVSAIFLFTGDSGRAHGYHDRWEPDGTVFNFYGEGQNGDMQLTKGNAAIATHATAGKSLLLFSTESSGGYCRFAGQFYYLGVAEEFQTLPGRKERKVLVFQLGLEKFAYSASDVEEPMPPLSIAELRKRALAAADANRRVVSKAAAIKTIRERSQLVRTYALTRAGGQCEQCGADAPFSTKLGRPYLEVHHTHRLADDGPDHPAWVAAICPTCHRRIHFGIDGAERNHLLMEKIAVLESELGAAV
jgi:5-methylcytosine-specific restriction protein A